MVLSRTKPTSVSWSYQFGVAHGGVPRHQPIRFCLGLSDRLRRGEAAGLGNLGGEVVAPPASVIGRTSFRRCELAAALPSDTHGTFVTSVNMMGALMIDEGGRVTGSAARDVRVAAIITGGSTAGEVSRSFVS